MEARYDLKYMIAGFDFYHWLVTARERGATKIVFGINDPKENKWQREEVIRRFHSIIEPGPALAKLEYRIGDGGSLNIATSHMRDFVLFCRKNGNEFKRLESPNKSSEKIEFTVTIRNEPRIPDRNSNIPAWEKFAQEIGATIIEDYADKEISLLRRMEIYSGARMNFGVPNGPMQLLMLTEYPVVMFKTNMNAKAMMNHEVPFGTQLSWARKNQFLVWEDDNYDNLMRWFDAWNSETRA